MTQNTEIVLDMLTSDSVSVLKKLYFEVDGARYYYANERNAYTNDEEGRAALKSALPTEYYNTVIALWNFEV